MARLYRPRIDYRWAPSGARPLDMGRFMQWAYFTYCWARGNVFWMAKFKPSELRNVYEYWRRNYAA